MISEPGPLADPDAEEALLGSCLMDGGCVERVASTVKASDFYRERNATIWRAMLALAEAREPVDRLTVSDVLRQAGQYETVGGNDYLTTLAIAVPSSVHAPYYAGVIARYGALRRLLDAGCKIAGLAHDATDPDLAIAQAEQLLLAVRRGRQAAQLITPEERAERAIQWLGEMEEGIRPGIPWGLRDLDSLTGGVRPGQLVLVAGRPGTGKSTLLQGASEHWGKLGKRVLYCTIEMPEAELTKRTLAWSAKVNLHKLVTGDFLDRAEKGRLSSAVGDLATLPVYPLDDPGMTTASIRAAATEMQLRYGLDVICVDYLQLLCDERHGSNDVGRVTYISRQLVGIARSLGVPLVAASQLSRKVEGREDGLPRLSDLRESGALEQDAHVVLLIHREKPKPGAPKGEGDPVTVIVAKNRQGPTGKALLVFIPRHTRFVELDWRQREGAFWPLPLERQEQR